MAPFPLKQFLILYSKNETKFYLNHFADLKLIKDWIGPQVYRSTKLPISIPTYLLTYECQELGKILGEHPTVIWQELLEIYYTTLERERKQNEPSHY